MMSENQQVGFVYTVEVLDAQGNVMEAETIHNLMPIEGLQHVINTVLRGGTQVPQWYVGVYESAYTPVPGDVMSDFVAAAGECTAYAGATRRPYASGTPVGGATSNADSVAEFEFSATKTIYGGFISSASAKGSTSGVLLSAVRFGSPKNVDSSSTLRVTAGFTLSSL